MRYTNTLREARLALDLTQWEVAKSVDIPLDRYGRLEQGRSEPSVAEGARLARFFKRPVHRLFPAAA